MVSRVILRNDDAKREPHALALVVAPDRHLCGIGSALQLSALTAADKGGGEPLVVPEVSPAFYGRLGCEHSELYGISINLPTQASPDAAQIVRPACTTTTIRHFAGR